MRKRGKCIKLFRLLEISSKLRVDGWSGLISCNPLGGFSLQMLSASNEKECVDFTVVQV